MRTIDADTLRSWLEAGKPVVVLDVRAAAGLLADVFGGLTAIAVITVLTFLSGVIAAAVMHETH